MPNWNQLFVEVQTLQGQSQVQALQAIDLVRRKYIKKLHDITQRNVIAYYSGWLQKPGIFLADINDEDKNAFMTTVHGLSRDAGLDLILHTPGGGIAATQSIVNYLQKMFNRDIRAFIPQIAMSAGTIIACCCKEIWMGKHSNLGPIDPHLRGIPAYGAVEEFKRAIREVKNDASRTVIWQQIIGQYRPTFLGQCENAIKWSNEFVEQQLTEGMLSGRENPKREAKRIRKALSDYAKNKSHERHFHAEELLKMGLEIKNLEDDQPLQEAVLSVHHGYILTLMNTNAYKMIENHNGIGIVKNAPAHPSAPGFGQKAEQPT